MYISVFTADIQKHSELAPRITEKKKEEKFTPPRFSIFVAINWNK